MEKYIITEKDLRSIVRDVLHRIRNKTKLKDGIYEISDETQLKQYSNIIWQILQNSYKELGGFKSYGSIDEMLGLISLATICVRNGKIVACAIYRGDLGGQKLNGCGTIDGSEQNKSMLRAAIKDDIDNFKKYHWVEVSYPLEKWFKELGGNPIPVVIAHKLLHKSKGKIEDLGDGVHYRREMGKDKLMVTKAIYGFQSETVYQTVMKNIEKWSGFEKYEDYKQHINTLPKINENIDYSMNHENNFVALSMEVVIQIGNLWDDGVTEITPQMRNYLLNALKVLQNYNPKNSQINALIKNGLYYINNMDVLTDNICNDYDYIVKPAI